jgi:hypothetical protein
MLGANAALEDNTEHFDLLIEVILYLFFDVGKCIILAVANPYVAKRIAEPSHGNSGASHGIRQFEQSGVCRKDTTAENEGVGN